MLLPLSQQRPHRALPDAELLARYQGTSDAAYFEELFARYQDKVFPLCFKLLRDKEESKDACMEIFEKAGKSLLKDNVERLNDWLFVVVKNHCYDKLRRRKLRPAAGMDDEELEEILWKKGECVRPEYDANGRQSRLQEVEAGLRELHEPQRICVERFYCEGESYKAIAEQTGYTLNQVKSYLQNGIRNLRIMLDQE